MLKKYNPFYECKEIDGQINFAEITKIDFPTEFSREGVMKYLLFGMKKEGILGKLDDAYLEINKQQITVECCTNEEVKVVGGIGLIEPPMIRMNNKSPTKLDALLVYPTLDEPGNGDCHIYLSGSGPNTYRLLKSDLPTSQHSADALVKLIRKAMDSPKKEPVNTLIEMMEEERSADREETPLAPLNRS